MFKKIIILVIISLPSFGLSVAAQSVPLEEHKMLMMDEGVWRATMTLQQGPGQASEPIVGIETNTMIGELWSVGKFEAVIEGAPYVGFATLGYDPAKGQYVGTWVDSSTSYITEMQGSYDAVSSTLTLFYTTAGPGGQVEERKNVMVYANRNTRDFDMFLKTNGEWVKSMEILYERLE